MLTAAHLNTVGDLSMYDKLANCKPHIFHFGSTKLKWFKEKKSHCNDSVNKAFKTYSALLCTTGGRL